MADVELGVRMNAKSIFAVNKPRFALSRERAMKMDWLKLCEDAGQVMTAAVCAGVESKAVPGEVPHDVIVKYAALIAPIIAHAYQLGLEDSVGREPVQLKDGNIVAPKE